MRFRKHMQAGASTPRQRGIDIGYATAIFASTCRASELQGLDIAPEFAAPTS